MAGNNEVKIVFSAKTEEAANAVRDAAKKIDNLGESGQKAKSSVDKLDTSLKRTKESALKAGDSARATTASWAEMAIGIDSTINLLNRAAGLAKSALDLAKDAARFQETKDNFSRFAASVGADSNKILSALKKASAGTIETRNLITTASRALALGVTTDADKIGNLMEIARAKAKILGTDVTSAFNDIVTGIGRGSPQILDNLGIRIPEGFTATAKGMDSAKKTALLLDEVLKAENETLKGMGSQTESSADKFRQFETSLNDLKQNISEKFLPTAITLVDWLKDVVEFGGDAADALEWYAKGDSVFGKNDTSKLGVSGQIEALKQQKDELQKQKNAVFIDLYSNREGTVAGAFTFQSTIDGWKKEYKELSDNIADIDKQIADLEKNGIEIVRTTQETAKAAERQAEATQKAADEAERKKRADEEAEEIAKRHREEMEKQLLALSKQIDSGLNEALGITNKTLSESIVIMNAASMAALGFCGQVDKAAAAEYKLNQEAEKLSDEFFEAFKNASKLETSIENISNSNFNDAIKDLKSGSLGSGSVGLFASFGLGTLGPSANLVTTRGNDDVKTTSKNFWSAIKSDYGEAMTAAMAQGIIDSNLGEALRSTIGSIAASKASSYGSTLLSGLFSGNGFAGLGGAVSGFVGSIAISAIANNWDKWFGDKGKAETKKSNAETRERASNAYLQTYAAMLNPFMTNEQYNNLLNSRYAAAGNLVVSYKWKSAGGIRGIVGGKNYSDTTPQKTYDLIEAMENAVDVIKKYNDKKEKELDLLSAQGYSYQVLSEQMSALSDTMDRVRYMSNTYSDSWASGAKFSIDLSDNIQDLKKAYYEALREYGSETANRKTRAATDFLGFYPYLDDTIYGGTMQYVMGYKKSNRGSLAGLLGHSSYTPIYGQYDFDAIISDPYSAYRYVENASNQFDDRKATRQMLELVKMAGSNQYDLAALQYTDSTKYAEQYIEMLERSQTAAEIVMKEQERIYLDATQTFEQQSAALDMYQEAQNQYYNAKLEMLSAEQAKEEEIKKQQQQAALRSAERMEALLGFTGEIDKTGTKIYFLEGPDQIGALQELENQTDDPNAISLIQMYIQKAQNKNKYGKFN